jgi:GNAT superfamily N-acetyltransferase
MSSPHVRMAREEDWEAIRDLRLGALLDAPDAFGSTIEEERENRETDWRSWVTGWDGAQQVTILGFDGETPVGLAVGSRRDPTETVAHLFAMWVDPASRRRGTGRALVEAVVTWARAIGAGMLELRVSEVNHAAVRLYQKAGFVPTGERSPLRPGSEVVTITMARMLTSQDD